MYKFLINNTDYFSKIKRNTLEVDKNLDDYGINVDLMLTLEEAMGIEAGCIVSLINDTNKIICSGILYEIKYKKMGTSNLYTVSLVVDNYTHLASRITAKEIDKILDEDINLNKVENLFKYYYKTYLEPYGVVLGEIDTTLTISELTVNEEAERTLKEILDNLAELSKSNWEINSHKTFNVFKGKAKATQHKNALTQKDMLDFEMTKTLEGYRNRYTIIGGVPENASGIPDNYINQDGKLIVVVENLQEIERIKKLIGGDGVFNVREENSKLVDIPSMEQYANTIINKFGTPPVSITITIKNGYGYEAGDFIKVVLPEYGLDNWFCIDSINIQEVYNTTNLNFNMNLSKRLDNMQKENLWTVLSGNKLKPLPTDKPNGGGTVFVDSVDIQIQSTILTTAEVLFI